MVQPNKSFSRLTIRPGSVLARAKMNVIGLQAPSRSSFPPDTVVVELLSVTVYREGSTEHTLTFLNTSWDCSCCARKSQSQKSEVHGDQCLLLCVRIFLGDALDSLYILRKSCALIPYANQPHFTFNRNLFFLLKSKFSGFFQLARFISAFETCFFLLVTFRLVS
jgi:hypothetical protein